MKVLQGYIEKFINTQVFVDIFTDEYDDDYLGYILKISDELLALESFADDDGQNDGIVILRLQDISRISWESNRIKEMEKLAKQSTRQSSISNIDITTLNTTLESVSKKYGYVVVHIQDLDDSVCFIGEIEALDNDTLILNEYGTRSSLDRRKILLKTKDITRIDAGDTYSETIKNIYAKILI